MKYLTFLFVLFSGIVNAQTRVETLTLENFQLEVNDIYAKWEKTPFQQDFIVKSFKDKSSSIEEDVMSGSLIINENYASSKLGAGETIRIDNEIIQINHESQMIEISSIDGKQEFKMDALITLIGVRSIEKKTLSANEYTYTILFDSYIGLESVNMKLMDDQLTFYQMNFEGRSTLNTEGKTVIVKPRVEYTFKNRTEIPKTYNFLSKQTLKGKQVEWNGKVYRIKRRQTK